MAGSTVNLVELSALVGAVLPVAVAVGKQDRFSRRANTLIAAAVALVAALVVVAVRDEFSPGHLAVSFTAIYATAVGFHHGLWKPTGVAARLQRRTSPRPAPRRRDLSRC
jgi:hypothetical protein